MKKNPLTTLETDSPMMCQYFWKNLTVNPPRPGDLLGLKLKIVSLISKSDIGKSIFSNKLELILIGYVLRLLESIMQLLLYRFSYN